MKLPNGYGTVSKLSGKRRKPWRACLPATYELTDTGNSRATRPVLGYYRTRSEALQALAEFHKDPAIFNATTLSFEKLYEFWSKEKYATAGESIILTMIKAYEKSADLYKYRLTDINTDLLQRMIDTVGTSYATRKSLKALYSQMFQFAIKNDFITKNPAKFVNIGKNEPKIIRRLFTKEEIDKYWDKVGTIEADTVLIMLYTGLRVGELYKLRVENIHLDEQYMIGGIKTKAGTDRIIPIADKILPLIKRYYNPEATTLMADGVQSPAYRMRVVKYVQAFGTPHTPHDTRYTFVSMMEQAGVPLLTTQKIIGHATGILTLDLYTKRLTQELIDAVNKL